MTLNYGIVESKTTRNVKGLRCHGHSKGNVDIRGPIRAVLRHAGVAEVMNKDQILHVCSWDQFYFICCMRELEVDVMVVVREHVHCGIDVTAMVRKQWVTTF